MTRSVSDYKVEGSKRTSPANIFDVAKLAGVSTATVSRALSSPERLRAGTLKRVQDAVAKLGYVSHGIARALASKRSFTIGAVFPTLDGIFSNTTHALHKALDEAGYALIVSANQYDPRVDLRMAVNLIERGVDGVVLVGTTHAPELYSRLKAANKPYVLSWATDRRDELPCVGFDNKLATALVTQHLVDLGHTRFAVISGISENNERVADRMAGIRETLAKNGLTIAAADIIEAAFTSEAGKAAALRLLACRPRPSAILCSNDVLAVGAISACHSLRLRVPDDISIAGGGNFDIAGFVVPALTTVRWPTAELGEHAARRLVAEIEGRPFERQRKFPVELIVRDSTGPFSRPKRRG